MPDLPPIPDGPKDADRGKASETPKPDSKPPVGPAGGGDPNRAPSPSFNQPWNSAGGGSPGGGGATPAEPAAPVPVPDRDYSQALEVPKGAYNKGLLWKWGARMQGGGILLFALMVLFGEPGPGFVFLIFALVFAAALTFQVGLKPDPTREKLAARPGGGLVGLGFTFQDKLGDALLTPAWNAIRRSTEFRT